MFLAGVSLWYFAAAIAGGVGAVVARCSKSRGTSWQLHRGLPVPPHLHLPRPRRRPARRRLPHHPGQDRAGLGRLAGRGFMQGTQSAAELPAREAHRLHLHHAGRGVRLPRHLALLVALRADPRLLLASAISNRDRFGALLTGGIAVDLLPALRGQHGDGDGADAGGRRAAAAGRPTAARRCWCCSRPSGSCRAPMSTGRATATDARRAILFSAPGGALAALAAAPARAPSPRQGLDVDAHRRPGRPGTLRLHRLPPRRPGRGLRALHPAQGGPEPLGRGRAHRRQRRR